MNVAYRLYYNICSILIIFLACHVAVHGDQKYYANSDATVQSSNTIDLINPPVAILDIATARSHLAGTANQFSLYLVGDLTVSGPHLIGPFVQGSRVKVPVTLIRKIGELVGVEFQAGGSDGWLLQRMNIQIANTIYLLEGPRQWLDRIDPANEKAYRTDIDSWEPLQSEDPSSIPVASKLKLKVVDKYFDYESDKIKPFIT